MKKISLTENFPTGKIFSVHRLRLSSDEKDSFYYHGHEYQEIMWIESGEVLHTINNREFSHGQGMLYSLGPKDAHSFQIQTGKRLNLVNVAFHYDIWQDILQRYGSDISAIKRLQEYGTEGIYIDRGTLAELSSLAGQLVSAAQNRFHIERFLLEVLNLLETATFPRMATMPSWLSDALAEIDKPGNFSKGASALSDLCGRSHEHVSRLLKQCLGKTPSQVVNEARMQHAARELAMTDRPILDICFECGINNPGHFFALFKKQHSMTPRAFRMRHLHKESLIP